MKKAQTVEDPKEGILATIEEVNIQDFFNPEKGMVQPLLKEMEESFLKDGEVMDPTTPDGRTRINAKAKQVSSIKVFLDNAGKDHVADLKRQIKVFDGERKALKDGADAIRDEILAPKIEWENKEAKRVEEIYAVIGRLKALGDNITFNENSKELGANLSALDELLENFDFQEFKAEAKEAYESSKLKIENAVFKLKQEEERLAEQEKVRIENERIQKENEEMKRKLAEMEAKQKEQAPSEPQIDVPEPPNGVLDPQPTPTPPSPSVDAKRAVNNAVLQALLDTEVFVLCGNPDIQEQEARKLVTLIAKGMIPNLRIDYAI